MAWYTYPPKVALDEFGGAVLSGSGQVFNINDTEGVAPLTPYDLNGLPLAGGIIQIEGNQLTQAFRLEDSPSCLWRSNGRAVQLDSPDGMLNAAVAAAAAAELSRIAAELAASNSVGAAQIEAAVNAYLAAFPPVLSSSVVWDNVLERPGTFAPDAHTHSVGDLIEATARGKLVLQADTAAQLRSLADAAPSSTVSFPGLSATDPNKAAPGGHTHAASVIGISAISGLTALNVQQALEQLLAAIGTGGGGSGSGLLIYTFRSGAYPSLPTTKPANIQRVLFQGPVPPTGLPSWMGLGSTQIPSVYEYVATT